MGKENLEWSLKPITYFLIITGIPTYDGRKTKWFYRFLINFIVALSIFCNVFYNGKSFVNDLSKLWDRTKQETSHLDHNMKILKFVHSLIQTSFRNVFPLSIQILFFVEFYLTGRWQQILNCITELDLTEKKFPKKFYYRCRKRCYVMIFISLLVIRIITLHFISNFKANHCLIFLKEWVLFSWQFLTKEGSILPFYFHGGIFSMLSVAVWTQLSVIGVISLFSVLVWTASSLAEELGKKLKEDELINSTMGVSNFLEKRLKDFDLFNRFTEEMNSCFGPILLLSLSNILVDSLTFCYSLQQQNMNNRGFNIGNSFRSLVILCVLPIILLYFRFLILVIGCNHLKNKV